MKNATLIIVVISVLFVPLISTGAGLQLTSVEDENITFILNNFQILAEYKKLPLLTRVFLVRDHGECDGKPETCPKRRLLIAISSFDEAPEQKLYESKKAFGWKFSEWISIPKGDGPDDYIVFSLTERTVSTDNIERLNWSETEYHVYVNLYNGFMKIKSIEK